MWHTFKVIFGWVFVTLLLIVVYKKREQISNWWSNLWTKVEEPDTEQEKAVTILPPSKDYVAPSTPAKVHTFTKDGHNLVVEMHKSSEPKMKFSMKVIEDGVVTCTEMLFTSIQKFNDHVKTISHGWTPVPVK